MLDRRTIVLILAGAGVGSVLTALLFLAIFSESSNEEGPLRTASAPVSSPTDPPSTDMEKAAGGFGRNIDGDCTLAGRIIDSERKPIAGATVGLWLLDQPWSSPQPGGLITSDEKGGFTLPPINRDIPVLLYAWKPGFAVASLDEPSCEEPSILVASEGSRLDIRVQDEKGLPVQGAEILIAGDNLWPPRTGKTDDDGALNVDGLPEGDVAVWAVHESSSAFTEEMISVFDDVHEVVLTNTPRPLTKLRVLAADDQAAVSDALVIASPSGMPFLQRATTTGPDGSVAIPCPDRSGCSFVVGESGFVDTLPVTVAMGSVKDVYLEKGGAISGIVADRRGVPVAGARLQVDEILGEETVALLKSEGKTFGRMFSGTAAVGWPRVSPLLDGMSIGPSKLPVPKVTCKTCAGGVAPSQHWASTDGQGRFVLDGLPQRRLLLSAEHEEMVMAGPPVTVDLSESSDAVDISVQMRRGSTAVVRTVDERGIPVNGVSVALYDTSGSVLKESVSDKDGYVELKGLPGVFKVVAALDGFVAAAQKVAGRVGTEVEKTLTLRPADKTMVGRVKDKNGFGLNGVALVARSIDRGYLQVVTGVTDADGSFTLEGIGSGSYSVSADGGEHGRATISEITYKEEAKLVLGMEAAEPREDQTLIEPDPNWSGDSLGGLQAALPIEETTEGGDNLGVIGGSPVVPSTTLSTQYGDADTLSVTGPPSGKGGLPINIGGQNGHAVVTGVVPGSRVESAGLTKGSRIVSVDGKRVSGPADAKKAIAGTIGSVLMLEVLEPGNPEPFTIIVQRVRTR